MKKILYSLIAVTIAFTSMAQAPKNAEKKEAKMHKKEHKAKADVSKKLNLTADQRQQMKTINDEFREKMQTLNSNTNTADIKQKREALIKDHQQRINNILTPAQRIQYDQLQKNRPSRGNGGFQRGGTARHDKDDKLEKLNLTPEQQSKAKVLNESFKNKRQEVEKNTALTEDQKKEQLKSLKQQHKEDIQSMLTAEQKEKLKIRVKNQPNRKAVK
jgi:Spy/CpxP family protein refolding chaperone